MELSRRDALKLAGLTAFGGVIGLAGVNQRAVAQSGTKPMPPVGETKRRYSLPSLPYDYKALEPVIDEETLRIHHGKHHAGYVNGANKVLDQLETARSSGDYGRIKALSRALAFTGSGVVLHNLYWRSMSPSPKKAPGGALAQHLQRDFGGLAAFKAQLAAAAKKVEGSGWAVLVCEPLLKKLMVLQVEKHQNLAIWGASPLLAIDVWEHAYYLKYQNRRADYVDAWMDIIDWDATAERFDRAMKTA
jgi:Fe-Mn family superoxide dismutase